MRDKHFQRAALPLDIPRKILKGQKPPQQDQPKLMEDFRFEEFDSPAVSGFEEAQKTAS